VGHHARGPDNDGLSRCSHVCGRWSDPRFFVAVAMRDNPWYERRRRSKGMFPNPPQLFTKGDIMTDDPEGETYWK
jgi:hypothetical protein